LQHAHKSCIDNFLNLSKSYSINLFQVQSLTPKALSSSVGEIGSVVSMIDRIAGSAPGNGSRAAVGEDLVAMTKCRLQARNFMSQDGGATAKKMKRHTSAMPLNNVSSHGSVNDSFKQLHGFESSELESTATSRIKRLKSEVWFYPILWVAFLDFLEK